MKVGIAILLFLTCNSIFAQELEISIYDFQQVENDYKIVFNSLNQEIDSLSNQVIDEITQEQRDKLAELRIDHEDQLFDDEKFLPVMEAPIEISTADMNLFHENYLNAINSFSAFLNENMDSLDYPEAVEYPYWPVRNNQFRTTIQTFKYVFNRIDRSISSYLFLIRYSMRQGQLESLAVGKYLNQNEYFDYYGILKHGLTVRLDKKVWKAYVDYYNWLIDIELKYSEQVRDIIEE
ncbi:MAG: hypothetical protein KFF73_01560 [Cyclobacteriaceae bacterium]|nr:hypothetical protein [Cyclobacteriaceae bacterium]